jgi:MFS family permease
LQDEDCAAHVCSPLVEQRSIGLRRSSDLRPATNGPGREEDVRHGRATTLAAALLLAGDFAPALLGPLTGTVDDRFDRKRAMVAFELVQGLLVAVTALWPPLTPLLSLVALRAAAGQVVQPASRAVVPAVVGDRDLERANAAVGIGTDGGEALGPLAAALLLPALEVRGVLLMDLRAAASPPGLLPMTRVGYRLVAAARCKAVPVHGRA